MAIKLTNYQEEATQELLQDTSRLLRQSGNKKLVFKAPTGSGKTITMAEFLARFADDKTHAPCAFIWTAPRQLHEQSKTKLERYFEDTRAIECSFFEDLEDRQIQENEVLFFNWESIRQENNIYIKENEQDNNLSSIIERTRDEGRAIVLIIDESHYHAQAETSQNLITAISPNLTIEVSATPVMQNPDKIVSVDIEDVKSEEMIKKAVVLNEDFKNVINRGRTETINSELSNSTDDIVLAEALKKRQELVKAYKKEGVDVNPLLLIQLPDRRGQADEDRQTLIIQTLRDKHGITTDNGKLAIYLSENKENLENLSRNDNEVEVLIFKQAIALGWDCPRAHILVLFREWHSPAFSIQTLGRIMRVSDPEQGYYNTDILNYGYVYTNIDDIEIKDDIGKNYVVTNTSHRIPSYKPISLISYHTKRQREQTRLSPAFTNIFMNEAKKNKLAAKIKVKGQSVHPAFITDWKAGNVDEVSGQHLKANAKIDTASEIDLQRLFDYFARTSLSPFHPEDRSVGRMKESIYKFFEKEMDMDRTTDFATIINCALSEDNKPHILAIIENTKREYISATQQQQKELVEESGWEIPEKIVLNGDYTELDAKKSVLSPTFTNEKWKSEKSFISFLEQKGNNVTWWFKNGDRDATYFAVPYKMGKDYSPFYVDFVVQMKDGSIGLFDPHGIHLSDFGAKSNGLKVYAEKMRKEGREITAGIVANTDSKNYTGQWMIYEGDGKDVVEGDWTNWKPLEL